MASNFFPAPLRMMHTGQCIAHFYLISYYISVGSTRQVYPLCINPAGWWSAFFPKKAIHCHKMALPHPAMVSYRLRKAPDHPETIAYYPEVISFHQKMAPFHLEMAPDHLK